MHRLNLACLLGWTIQTLPPSADNNVHISICMHVCIIYIHTYIIYIYIISTTHTHTHTHIHTHTYIHMICTLHPCIKTPASRSLISLRFAHAVRSGILLLQKMTYAHGDLPNVHQRAADRMTQTCATRRTLLDIA